MRTNVSIKKDFKIYYGLESTDGEREVLQDQDEAFRWAELENWILTGMWTDQVRASTWMSMAPVFLSKVRPREAQRKDEGADQRRRDNEAEEEEENNDGREGGKTTKCNRSIRWGDAAPDEGLLRMIQILVPQMRKKRRKKSGTRTQKIVKEKNGRRKVTSRRRIGRRKITLSQTRTHQEMILIPAPARILHLPPAQVQVHPQEEGVEKEKAGRRQVRREREKVRRRVINQRKIGVDIPYMEGQNRTLQLG